MSHLRVTHPEGTDERLFANTYPTNFVGQTPSSDIYTHAGQAGTYSFELTRANAGIVDLSSGVVLGVEPRSCLAEVAAPYDGSACPAE